MNVLINSGSIKIIIDYCFELIWKSRYKIWSKLDWIVIEITRCNIIKIHIVFVGYTLSLKWLTHTVITFKFILSDHASCNSNSRDTN